jgi:hypothetical protein
MRQTVCHQFWKHAYRTARPLGLAIVATILAGCVIEVPNPLSSYDSGRDKMPIDETGVWTNRPPTEKELVLTRSDFSVEIVRFTDSRRPRSMELQSDDQLIYQYDPDTLMGSVSHQVPAILSKYLSYRMKQPKHYKVEIDLKRLETVIKTGTFMSGSWGRYSVNAEVVATVRRPDSSVVFIRTYRYDPMQPRENYDGRGPSKERDRARMYDLTESVMREAAQDIGWDIRQRDARRWKVEAPQSIPTRLNQPPVDRAVGTPNADAKPEVNAPASAPVIVPATPSMWIDGPFEPNDDLPVQEVPFGPEQPAPNLVPEEVPAPFTI